MTFIIFFIDFSCIMKKDLSFKVNITSLFSFNILNSHILIKYKNSTHINHKKNFKLILIQLR